MPTQEPARVKNARPPKTPQDPRHRPTVGSQGTAVSSERGTLQGGAFEDHPLAGSAAILCTWGPGVIRKKHGLSTEQFPVSAYIGCSKNLKDRTVSLLVRSLCRGQACTGVPRIYIALKCRCPLIRGQGNRFLK